MSPLITSLLLTYHIPAMFLGAFLFGETVIISAAFLAGQDMWSLSSVFIWSFFGTLVSDCIWFLLGKKLYDRMQRNTKQQRTYTRLLQGLERLTGHRPFIALLFIKFLYGTRILTIMYLSVRNISLKTFALFDALGTVIWLIVMLLIGWLAGKGSANFLPALHNIEFGLLVLLLVVAGFKLITVWIEKRLIKR